MEFLGIMNNLQKTIHHFKLNDMINVVTFQQAKLLREAEFDQDVRRWWIIFNGYTEPTLVDYDADSNSFIKAPEQWQVIEWFRNNHNIWISVNISIEGGWYFELFNLKDKRSAEIQVEDVNIPDFFNSPDLAYSAAFDYILKYLL